ncbi:MAG: HAD-IB family phosphatase, partial [Alicyclobacillus mali]|uniref:HAD-IB family phosphatase n=1 Tax=Alicyclobacillus mali (ex Roth et al. 2021) TaxID=1123961 RepID=UPI0023F09C93
ADPVANPSAAATPRVPDPEPPRPGDLPIALLVDYDGTIATTDVGDVLMAAFVPGKWEAAGAAYDAGRVGSRSLMTLEMAVCRASREEMLALALEQPHDPRFVALVDRARAVGAAVEVVSDGFGFYVRPNLARLGVGDVTVVTNDVVWRDEQAEMVFPNGHPRCFVCGTCKRWRVLGHQAVGRRVVFVGDGHSDRYAAGYADVVFAKGSLVGLCEAAGWAYRPWRTFDDVDAWLAAIIDAWRRDPTNLPAPVRLPFYCGPEVWGPDRSDPA